MQSDNRAEAQVDDEAAEVFPPHLGGQWSEPAPWGFIPLHAALTPDGKLLTYGLNSGGTSYGDNPKIFDTWDPVSGNHDYELDRTGSTLYCSITVSDPGSDGLMILGGTSTAGDDPPNNNFGLRYRDNGIIKLGPAEQMVKPRWYPSALTLSDGRILVQGGTDNLIPAQEGKPVITPEIYKPGEPWRLLTGATSQKIYGENDGDDFSSDAYNYPRSWITKHGTIFGVTGKHMYYIDPDGNGGVGSINELGEFPSTNGRQVIGSSSAAVRFSANKVLQVGGNGENRAVVIDLSPEVATVTATAPMAHARVNGDATVLPDGSVFVNGGSAARVDLGDVAYVPEIWTPENGGTWNELNANSIPRLYHSAAVLLPDGSVWVGGGGQDGPPDPDDLNNDGETDELNNRNAQIFKPPYLFTDDGQPVPRYSIAGAPAIISIDGSFEVTITPRTDGTIPNISKVRLLRNGNSTHSTNSQTAEELEIIARLDNGRLRLNSPRNEHLATPGDYHLFAVDDRGVPSKGAPVRIEIPVTEPPDRTVPDEPVRVRSVWQSDSGYLSRAAELRGGQWKPSIHASLEQLTNPTWRSRQWEFEPAGDGLYRIRSRWFEQGDNPRPYLTRTARRVGENWVPADGVRLENYQASWGSQKWKVTPSDDVGGGFIITNSWSPASGVLTRSGSALSVAPPIESQEQQWTITPL